MITGRGYTGHLTDEETVIQPWSAAIPSAAFRWRHAGSAARAEFKPENPTGIKKSYLHGRDERKWVKDLPTYKGLVRQEVYPGIDIHYHDAPGAGSILEYDFVVKPGADPGPIALSFGDGTRLTILPDGSLDCEMQGAHLRHKAPRAYTETGGVRHAVAAKFRKSGAREVQFALGRYDRSQTLVIDPELLGLNVSGGLFDDEITARSSDRQYLVGVTNSPDYPGPGIQTRPSRDIFVRFSNQGTVYVIGGSGDDRPLDVYSSSQGAFVVGETNSRDLPVTNTALQREYGGGESDGFVLILPRQPGPIRELSYFGGSGVDRIKFIRGIQAGEMVFAGESDSPDLPGIRAFGQNAAGQMDVFMLSDRSLEFSGVFRPSALRIIGGSGDDFVSAIYVTTDLIGKKLVNFAYLAGETLSANFPRVGSPNQELSGPSDAFWMQFNLSEPGVDPIFSRIYGGEGRDRFSAMQLLSGIPLRWILAGDTTSPSLPGQAAPGSVYHGGFDLMAVWFDGPSESWERHAYVGGTKDEKLSAAGTFPNVEGIGFAMMGSTSSEDLPAVEAFQSEFGGGETDGIYAQLRLTGELEALSYLGGSGRDAITGFCSSCTISFFNFSRLAFFGLTDSPSFPATRYVEGAVVKDARWGGLDIFETSVLMSRAPYVNEYLVAPGMFTPVSIFTPLTVSSGTAATLTVNDPALVRLTADPGTGGEATSLSLDVNQSPNAPAWLKSVAGEGETTLKVEVPGLPAGAHPVRVGRIRASFPATGVQQPTRLPVGAVISQQARIEWYSSTLTRAIYPSQASFPSGENTLKWKLENLTPDTLSASFYSTGTPIDETPLFQGRALQYIAITIRGLGAGPFRLRLSAPGTSIEPAEFTGEVTAAAAASIQNPPALMREQSQVKLAYYSNSQIESTARLVSSDPSRLGISLRDTDEPSGELRLVTPGNSAQQIVLHGLSEGPVTLRLETEDGFLVQEYALRVVPPVLVFTSPVVPDLQPGIVSGLGALNFWAFDSATGNVSPTSGSMRAGFEATVRLEVSDPEVLQLQEPLEFTVPVSGVNLTAQGLKPGTAMVRIADAKGVHTVPQGNVLEAHVRAPRAPGTIQTLIVGRGLFVAMSINVPFTPEQLKGGFQITSTDPAKVLLSGLGTPQPASTIAYPANSSPNFVLRLDGLETGDVNLRVNVAGLEPANIPVRVLPSGYLFTLSEASLLFNGSGSGNVTAHPIDPDTGIPSPPQTPRSGTPAPEIVVENPALAAVTLRSTSSGFEVLIQGKAVGSTRLRIVQPTSMIAARVRQALPLEVVTGYINLGGATVGANLQTRLNYSVSGRPILRLRSSDPSRLVMSKDANSLGTGEVEASTETVIYLQSLGGTGLVEITAEAQDYKTSPATITIMPAGFAWTNSDEVRLATQQKGLAASGFTVVASGPDRGVVLGQAIRPGLGSVRLTTAVADPALLRVQEPAQSLLPTEAVNTFKLNALAPGKTVVSLTAPAGFPSMGALADLTVTIAGPKVGFGRGTVISVLRDQQIAAAPNLIDVAEPFAANRTVTLTSSDPARLLVSADRSKPGSASAVSVVSGGQLSGSPVFLQALSDTGTLQLIVSGEGLEGSATDVTLGPSLLRIAAARSALSKLVVGESMQVSAFLVNPRQLDTPLELRAGLAIPIQFSADNDAVDIQPASATLTGAALATTTVRAVRAGVTAIAAEAPAGAAGGDEANRRLAVTVANPPLQFNPDSGTLPRYTMIAGSVRLPSAAEAPVQVHIVSRDPSQIQFSASADAPPEFDITVTVLRGQLVAPFFLHGVGRSGTTEIVAQAAGYDDARAPINHTPGAIFVREIQTQGSILALGVLSAPARLEIGLAAAAGGGTFYTSPPYTLSPLAGPVTVELVNQSPTVGRLEPASVALQPGPLANKQAATFTALAAGETLLTVNPPSGWEAGPALQARVLPSLLRVSENSLIIGRSLLARFSVSPDFVPNRDITLTARVNDPSLAAISRSATVTGAATVAGVFRANQPLSFDLFVTGLASGGETSIVLEASGLESVTIPVRLTPSALVFQNGGAELQAQIGDILSLGVASVRLRPDTLTVDAAQSVAASVSAVISASNASLVTLPSAAPVMATGTSSIDARLRMAAAGQTQIKLAQPAGFTAPARGDSLQITIR